VLGKVEIASSTTHNPLKIGLFASGMIHRWFYPGAQQQGSATRFT
jgi:hypothetical protein